MSQQQSPQPRPRRSGARWSIFAAVAILAVATVFWWRAQQQPAEQSTQASPAPVATASASASTSDAPLTATDATAIEAQQAAAARAAVGSKPIDGPVTQQPDFVSDIEWRVLRAVAGSGDNSNKTLTRLVNKLLFAKQQEQWRALSDSSSDPALRHEIAQQLLDAIPAQVSAGNLDLASAQNLQRELLADLISDPHERNERAAQEVNRLHAPVSQG